MRGSICTPQKLLSPMISVQVGTETIVEKLRPPNGKNTQTVETTFVFHPQDDEDFSLLMELCDAVSSLDFF